MDDRLQSYLDDKILASKVAALAIEREWLDSIGAPVKRIPKHVAEAVATRVFLSSIPAEFGRMLVEQIESERIISQALDQ